MPVHTPTDALPGDRLRSVGRIITAAAVALLLLAALAIGYALFKADDARITQLVNEKSTRVSQAHVNVDSEGQQIILAGDPETKCEVSTPSGQSVPVGPEDSRLKGDGASRVGVGTFEASVGTYQVQCAPDKDVVLLPASAVNDVKTAGTVAGISAAGIPVFVVMGLVGAILWAAGSKKRAKASSMSHQNT